MDIFVDANDLIKTAIPPSAWKLTKENNEVVYVLTDPTYTNMFWLYMWNKVFADLYRRQNQVQLFRGYDVTIPVYISLPSYKLINLPQTLQNIIYYSTFDSDYKPNMWYVTYLTVNWCYYVYLCLMITLLLIYYAIHYIKQISQNNKKNYEPSETTIG